jgi:hypothetical protein
VTDPDVPQCSAKGCRADALWALVWNNPKIHTPDRRKIWLACNAHREQLGTFLSRRGFLRETVPFEEFHDVSGAGQSEPDEGTEARAEP